jgi:2-polyprenyl-3-methyl-5-hydroxy-6-metoxy-1,4-benzoquinol methylase
MIKSKEKEKETHFETIELHVITPHPHAAIMAKYAEVAQRRTDPWVEFEYKHKANKNWISFISYPNFNIDYNYRYIGDNK